MDRAIGIIDLLAEFCVLHEEPRSRGRHMHVQGREDGGPVPVACHICGVWDGNLWRTAAGALGVRGDRGTLCAAVHSRVPCPVWCHERSVDAPHCGVQPFMAGTTDTLRTSCALGVHEKHCDCRCLRFLCIDSDSAIPPSRYDAVVVSILMEVDSDAIVSITGSGPARKHACRLLQLSEENEKSWKDGMRLSIMYTTAGRGISFPNTMFVRRVLSVPCRNEAKCAPPQCRARCSYLMPSFFRFTVSVRLTS